MEDQDRSQRYVQNHEEFCKSANFNQIRPFFDGDFLGKRMAKIREGIVHVRENWSRYDEFIQVVQKYIAENVKDVEAKVMMENVLNKRLDWAQSSEDVDSEFGAIRLYTSDKAYTEIFSLVNRVFRDVSSTDDNDLIIAAVFIVELINIDLFNYCVYNDSFANFTGVVYRGMAVEESDFEAYKTLRGKDIPSRYIATPLSLMSSSTSITQATVFIERGMNGRVHCKPILMKIHVIELESEYLRYYQKRFPTSVVSTICAVDIKNLSIFSEEHEVLLRGPFFQVLDFYDGDFKINDQTCKVLEMVMLNTNRDHISVITLGEDTAPARQLFGNMVAASRFKFAIRYYENKGQVTDAEDYKKLLKEKLETLKKLMDR